MKTVLRTLAAVAVLGLLVAGGLALYLARYGLSARERPSAIEEWVARRFRGLAVPSGVRTLANPLPATPERLSRARAHFADHGASCHANDGRGKTTLGSNMYPPAPDMTQSGTQSLSDGAIFHAIKNGIRLTGMPAWGDPGNPQHDEESWELVHFIRHLPRLTSEELAEMEALNPKSPAQFRKEEEERRFLEGDGLAAGAETTHRH
jgi:mono/diheme cytochrome c family protein